MTNALLWLHDPSDPRVVDALTRKCAVCGSAAGKHCFSPIDGGDLTGRVCHLARIEFWRVDG